ncbi:MAG: ABC transporter ATP-binding protein/permease [Firmicutes bacterium]|nr:ABC transporter ATP-binding protein/permease [Bacillota bacterium]
MIKKLSRYVGEYKKYAIITPVLVTLEALMEIVIPLLMAQLIDRGIDAGNMGEITKYGVILLAAALLTMTFGVLAGKTAPMASAGFAKNLRQAMYYKVQDFSFANIDKFSTGSIVTRLTTDVTNVQQAFQMIIRITVRAPGMLIFALIAAFSVNHKLSLIFLAVLPVLGLGMFIIIKRVYPLFNKIFRTYDKLNNVVQENLYAVRVVKSFNRQEHENEKFENVSGKIYKDFSKAEKTMSFVMPLMQACMYTCMILISWIGARMIVASGNDGALGLTTGQLMSMITYTMQILMSLMMISMIFAMMTMAKASGERIVEILDEESEIRNPQNPVMEVKDGSIDFVNTGFRYSSESADDGSGSDSKKVLENINLHIDSGATVGIIGATGSSKSSLVQLIPRLYDVSEGQVKVGDVDVRDYDIETLRNQVAMVLQKNVLFSGTIRENLRWGNENATDEEIIHACKVACADEFIEKFENGYDTYIEQGGTNVSGGQKQRLCIARALLKKPKILILDDSTSAVDMRTDALIRNAFASELPDTTKIIIAQRISSVQDSDMIIVMDDGRVADCGTHEELMERSEIYREVYESQNRKGGDAA